MTADRWEARYRSLESEIESILRHTQRRLAILEAGQSLPPGDPGTPRIRSLGQVRPGVVCCVADGADLEYRFFVTIGGQSLLDTGFTPLNSVTLIHPGALTVAVQVRSRARPGVPASEVLALEDTPPAR